MMAVSLLPKPEEVPPELRSLPRWICWKEEQREGAKRPTKIPVAPRTEKKGAVNALDPTNWSTLEEGGRL